MSHENDEKTVADLPSVEVEFTIDVPEAIEKLARVRFEKAKEERDLPADVSFEDYLMDHIDIEWKFDLENDD